jgi:two-component system nitrate/nitrite response regulator NarL
LADIWGEPRRVRENARVARISVLIADDHPLYRESVIRAVRDRPELDLLEACDNGRDALARIRELVPDVAVLDIKLPGLTGTEIVRALVRDGAATRPMLLSAFNDAAIVYDALAAGAAGYVTKDAGRREICEAIERVARDEIVVSPALTGGLARQIRQHSVDSGPRLTEREHQILSLTADGLSAPDIGRELHLSPATVKTHLQHVYEKLGVSDRAAAVAEAMRQKLLE